MRSRPDWKRGRWNINLETTLVHRALRGWQRSTGDSVTYWRWNDSRSEMHAVYDEAAGVGRVFDGPWQIPVLHVVHSDAANSQPRDSGLYVTDTLSVSAEFNQLARTGLTMLDLRHGAYQRDRLSYDGLLFGMTQIRVLGQIRRRDIVVSISCEQLKDDELVNDPEFVDYSADPSELGQGFFPKRAGS